MRGLLLTAVAVLLTAGTCARADGWGTIKGQVILDEDKIKPQAELAVTQDRMHCLSKGALLSDKYVIDPRSKGVRWVMVWIAADKDGKADHEAKLPIHKNLVDIKEKAVTIDQPCCKFDAYMMGLRKGQDFVGKNSAPVAHTIIVQNAKTKLFENLI